MKDKPVTDEMLHAYVDGELNTRQKTEVKRLLDRDEALVTQVTRIKKTRQMVEALHREEAPVDIADQVLAVLERKTLLGERKVSVAAEATFRGRMLRRIRPIAAVLVLFAALGGLVYSIMAPAPGTYPRQPEVAQNNYDVLKDITADVQLAGTLVLSGNLGLTAQLDQSLKENGFSGLTTANADGVRYAELECSRLELSRLIQEINQDCPALTDSQLTVCALAGHEVEPVEIPGVQPRQISTLLDVADTGEACQLASEMSNQNQINPVNTWGLQDMLPIPSLTENLPSSQVKVVLVGNELQP